MAEQAPSPTQLGSIIPRPIAMQQIAIPYFYFNGFELNSSLSDMSLLLMLDGQPMARLGLSFTMAKTLAENLTKGIASFEEMTSHNIMTMDQVKDFMDSQKAK